MKTWLKVHWQAIVFVTIMIVLLGHEQWQRAQAAEPVVQSAPPCDPIAATGNIVISRCEDPDTGTVLYVNNIGFMTIEE